MTTEHQICPTSTEETPKTLRFKPHYTSDYNDEEWQVKIAMPGVQKSDLDISIENEILSITGIRKMSHPEEWRRLTGYEADRQYELRLDVGPEVDGTKIEAKLENGQLLVRLPLKDEAKPKTIPVA